MSAAPGDHNIPLTVTAEYVFSNSATGIQGLLHLPSGFSLYNGSSTAFASVSGIIPSSSTLQMSFQGIFIASNLARGTYVFPLNITWTAAGYSYVLNQLANITIAVLGRPQLFSSLNTMSLTPAQINYAPLVISNNGSGSASNIFVTVSSQQIAVLNVLPEIMSLKSGSQISEVIQVFPPLSAAGNVIFFTISLSYKDPYGNNRTSAQVISTYVLQPAQPSLRYVTAQQSLSPGKTNLINMTLTNTGTIGLSHISTVLSTQSQYVSVVGTFPYIQSLNPGSSVSGTIGIYVSPTASNSAVSITLTASFVETNGMSSTSSQILGFSTSNYANPVSNISIAIIPLVTSLNVGSVSPVSFDIENLGNLPIYSPSIALTVSTPLVVNKNSSFSVPGYVIPSGGSMNFYATLSSSPGAAPGAYPGQLMVSVFDQSGNSYEKTFNVGFTLLGTIEFVVQDETLVQSGPNLTISGTLLNEGSTSAYYTSVVASVEKGTPGISTYVGEVDPNTPVPFVTSASYPSGQAVSSIPISLTISFKDNFGTNKTTIITSQVPVSSATLTSTTPRAPGVQTSVLLAIVSVIVIIVIVAVSVIALRRRRVEKGRESKVM